MVDFFKIHQQELEQQDHQIPEMARYKKNEAYLEFKQRVWVSHVVISNFLSFNSFKILIDNGVF